jgi:hypothetical protein
MILAVAVLKGTALLPSDFHLPLILGKPMTKCSFILSIPDAVSTWISLSSNLMHFDSNL